MNNNIKFQTRSVCTFCVLTIMLNNNKNTFEEYETFLMSKGYNLCLEKDGNIPLFRLRLQQYIKNIDDELGSKSVFKEYISWNLFYEEIIHVVRGGKPVVLYLSTGELTYTPIYQKHKRGKHCVILRDIKDNKFYIEDKHIRNGSKFEEFVGWIDKSEIHNQIFSYAYQMEYGNLQLSKERILTSVIFSLAKQISITEKYLDEVWKSLEKTKNLERDCFANYVHMNIFGGLHFWCYLYDFLTTSHMNRCTDKQITDVYKQIQNWDLLKTKIIKYIYTNDKYPIIERIDKINEQNQYIISTLKYV